MKENKLAELSMDFSVQIIDLVKNQNTNPLFPAKSGAPAPLSALTYTKQTMRRVRKILSPSWKLP